MVDEEKKRKRIYLLKRKAASVEWNAEDVEQAQRSDAKALNTEGRRIGLAEETMGTDWIWAVADPDSSAIW